MRKTEYQQIRRRIVEVLTRGESAPVSALSLRFGVSGAVIRRIAKEIGVAVMSYEFPSFDSVQASYARRREGKL